MNIHPSDIEFTLGAHPAIAEAAVVGAPDREFGEQVVAFVVTREDVSGDGVDRLVPRAARGVQGSKASARRAGAATQQLRQGAEGQVG